MIRVASIFSQILSLFPRTEFQHAVNEHQAERFAKGFSCWERFVAMLFCQLAQVKSLREICSGQSCCLGKLQHLGVRTAPNKSTLAHANQHRPWQLYELVFGQLLTKTQALASGRTKFRFRNKLYSFDSTVVDLCLSMFDWAKFRRTKGAIKLHLLLDHEGYLPTFAVVSTGKVPDLKMAWALDLPSGSVVVMGRAYNDYLLFGSWCEQGVWFVARMKDNTTYRVVQRRSVTKACGVVCDQIIKLTGSGAWDKCPTCCAGSSTRAPRQNRRWCF